MDSASLVEPNRGEVVEDFVVAIHDFTAVSSGSNICLSFSAGQVIRVLNRDGSGWWDGETVAVSEDEEGTVTAPCRGWFPSNYVTPLDSSQDLELPFQVRRTPSIASVGSVTTTTSSVPDGRSGSASFLSVRSDHSFSSPTISIEPTLYSSSNESSDPNEHFPSSGSSTGSVTLSDPIRKSIDLLRIEIQEGRIATVQPATANIISSVRSLLTLTDCLNRESSILKLHPALARERKQVLSVLGVLVDKARRLTIEHTHQIRLYENEAQPIPVGFFHHQLNEILQSAEKVFHNVRRFLLITHRSGLMINHQPVPPTQSSYLDPSTHSLSTIHEKGHPYQSGSTITTPTTSHDLRLLPHSPIHSPAFSEDSHRLPIRQTSQQSSSHQSTHSTSLTRPRASTSISQYQIPSFNGQYTTREVLEMLEQAHDCVLSTVAVFIGHAHLHSSEAHPSSHAYLIDMTRDVIERVREMLVLVESISKQGVSQSALSGAYTELTQARESLYLATTGLVTAARVATSGPLENNQPIEGEQNPLLVSATSLLRAANECMASASQCLETQLPESGGYEVMFADAFSTEPSSHNGRESRASTSGLSEGIHHHSPSTPGRRSRHTISMLGRKGNSLQCPSPDSDSEYDEDHSPDHTSMQGFKIHSDDWHDSSEHGPNSSTLPETSTAHSSPQSVDTSFSPSQRGFSVISLASDSGQDISRPRSISLSSLQTDGSRESTPPSSASISISEERRITKSSAETTSTVLRTDTPVTFEPTATVEGRQAQDWLSSRDYPPEEVSFNPEGNVIGGTLRGLVERMTLHDTPIEATFSHTFFLTFRMFTTPVEFARALITRFSIEGPKDYQSSSLEEEKRWQVHKIMPIRLRVYNVLKSWLELHWKSETDSSALSMIADWAKTMMLQVLRIPAERFLSLVHRRIEEAQKKNSSLPTRTPLIHHKTDNGGILNGAPSSAPPLPIVSKQLMSMLRGMTATAEIGIMEIDPSELARQITLLESKLYCGISAEEIIGQDFSKKCNNAPNVRAMSVMTTRATGWYTECILNEDDVRRRCQILKYCLKLGARFLELQNYNGLMAVMSALNSSTITRLKRTWEGVGTKSKTIYETLNRAVNHDRNYAEYRASLRKAKTPCLPFLGVYLTDITFCHEGNPTHRSSPMNPNLKLINFDRYQKMSKIINDLQRFQVPYSLIEVPEIVSFIKQSLTTLKHAGSADSLYRRSLFIEPRENSNV
ncbi:ras guanine nucleotide exchange factor domain-containing protein [Melampsora americana]|nr:ras guanine nucleotide exchange factor domain-containing protein [Melampsora americana]